MGPIRHTGDVPVFDRVVMNVVAMVFKIPLIANLVFPIAVLPDGLFAFALEGGRTGGFERGRAMAGEMGFNPHPADGVIRVVRWQGPETVQVVG